MLYLVLYKKSIIGRFKTKEKAIQYMINCWFDGMEGVKVKRVTKKEYKEMALKEIKNPC